MSETSLSYMRPYKRKDRGKEGKRKGQHKKRKRLKPSHLQQLINYLVTDNYQRVNSEVSHMITYTHMCTHAQT